MIHFIENLLYIFAILKMLFSNAEFSESRTHVYAALALNNHITDELILIALLF